MKKNKICPLPVYFDRYINKTDDVSYKEALEISLIELMELPVNQFEELGNRTYAEGKWTVKDILQHLIDTERVFSFRVTAFSRNDLGKILPFDEELYAKNAFANRRNLQDIIEELIVLRKSFIHLYNSFSSEMLFKSGIGFKGEYSVLSVAFMIAGHQRWHMGIIKERYLPLLDTANSKH